MEQEGSGRSQDDLSAAEAALSELAGEGTDVRLVNVASQPRGAMPLPAKRSRDQVAPVKI